MQICAITTLKVILFVGGTLGLFTGMSILSMIEIGFWILKCILSYKKPLIPEENAPA